jgi:hypothetical protein
MKLSNTLGLAIGHIVNYRQHSDVIVPILSPTEQRRLALLANLTNALQPLGTRNK